MSNTSQRPWAHSGSSWESSSWPSAAARSGRTGAPRRKRRRCYAPAVSGPRAVLAPRSRAAGLRDRARADPPHLPAARRADVADDYHGTKVADPYRWLEDVRLAGDAAPGSRPRTRSRSPSSSAIPRREAISERLTELWNYERYRRPVARAAATSSRKNDGLQNQNVLYVADGARRRAARAARPEHAVAGRHGRARRHWRSATTASSSPTASPTPAPTGHVEGPRRRRPARPLDDEVEWVKFSRRVVDAGRQGFFYSRFDEPKPGEKLTGIELFQKLYYHRLGTPQADDVLVYERPDDGELGRRRRASPTTAGTWSSASAKGHAAARTASLRTKDLAGRRTAKPVAI